MKSTYYICIDYIDTRTDIEDFYEDVVEAYSYADAVDKVLHYYTFSNEKITQVTVRKEE